MQITSEISLGTILTIATLIGIAIRFGFRLGHFETTLNNHAKTLVEHATRLGAYEARIVDIVSDLQRLIGRVEASLERRRESRP